MSRDETAPTAIPAAVMYTLVSPSLWFAAPSDPAPVQAEVTLGQRRLLLERGSDGAHRVARLISTDPRDYLDPRWQPGAVWQPPGGPAF